MVYNLVRETYSAFKLNNYYKCLVINNDAYEKLSHLFPVNTYQLDVDTAKETPLLNESIEIISLITIVKLDYVYYFLLPTDVTPDCISIFRESIDEEDIIAEFDDIFLIEGPEALSVTKSLMQDEIRSLQYNNALQFDVQNNIANVCLRCSFFGEIGFLLFLPNKTVKCIEYLDSLRFSDFADNDVAVLSAEANTKVWNKTIFKNECPFDLGLAHIFDFEDEDYKFNTNLNAKRKNARKSPVAVVFPLGDEVSCQNARSKDLSCTASGNVIGVFNRAYFSPKMRQVIAYARVDKDFSYLGKEVRNSVLGNGKVHKTPFFTTNSHLITNS